MQYAQHLTTQQGQVSSTAVPKATWKAVQQAIDLRTILQWHQKRPGWVRPMPVQDA